MTVASQLGLIKLLVVLSQFYFFHTFYVFIYDVLANVGDFCTSYHSSYICASAFVATQMNLIPIYKNFITSELLCNERAWNETMGII